MIAHRFLLPGFLLLILAAAPAWAQAPLVANRPPLPDLARDLLDGTLARGGAEPDTVEPWRYFPLEVGNAWEYESVFGYDPEWTYTRIDIPKDTLVDDRRYFIWDKKEFRDGNVRAYRPLVRYDSTSAQIVENFGDGSGKEIPFYWALCPFDAAFDSVVPCDNGGIDAEVTGTYEGVLDFEPDTTLTGVAVKTYALDTVWMDRFAAGFGKALLYEYESAGYHALRYARINGEEFGTEQYPVANESAGPKQAGRVGLEVWPNPFRDRLTVAFELPQAGPVVVEVVDVLGRVIRRRDLSVLAPGRHEVGLDGEALGAGVYLIRAIVDGAPVAVRPVTRLR